MRISRNTLETAAGPGEWFTGAVYIDAVAAPSGRPGSRPAASTSPRARDGLAHAPQRPDHLRHGGRGLCQRRGGRIEVIRAGDRVFFEPGEDHWHGAAPDRFMTHLAMQQVDEEGSPVTWGEHVTEEEYGAAPPIDCDRPHRLRRGRPNGGKGGSRSVL